MSTRTEKEPRWTGFREVMGMSGPIILGSLSYTIMQFIDQMMVSRLGTEAFAAVGSAGIWSYVMGCFIFGVVACAGTFVAQSFGRGDLEHCAAYAWQGVYLSFAAVMISLVLWPLSTVLFNGMGHAPAVTRFEILFFRIRSLGYVFMAWMTALAAFFQAIGRPGIPMYVAIVANLVNFALNYVLIFGNLGFPKLGIAGSATATVIAQGIQVALLQAFFMSRPINAKFGTRRAWRFDIAKTYDLLKIGSFSGLTIFMDVANWGIFTSFIVGHFGTVSLAAHNAALGFMQLCFMPALGVNQGISAIVGQYIGRRDFETASARTYTAMRIAMAYMFIMGLIFATFGRTLIHIVFNTDNPEVLSLGHTLLIMAAIFQAFDAINIVTLGALRGAGDTRWVAILTFVFAYFFFLPLSLFLAFVAGYGAVGAWIGATIYIIGLSGLLFRRFRSNRWQGIQIFSET